MFTHPEYSITRSNQQYMKLQFEMPNDTRSALVHGFAGYFDATLYKDVRLGIEPSNLSWIQFGIRSNLLGTLTGLTLLEG
ncbi:hypothetical protein CsSME_00027510 [Camellia sinensis var. sinensis]